MNLRRTWTILLAGVAAALLVSAPGASAKPGYFVSPGYRSVEVDLKASHGYRISISKSLRRYVSLSAYKGPNLVVYSARSLAPEKDRIKARFPGVGRVSVRFRPQGPPRESKPHPFPGCRGGEKVTQPGHFVGTIRFRGERGYTSVQATRVKGAVETIAEEVCKLTPSDDSEAEPDKIEFWAKSESGNEGVGFDASVLGDPFDLTSFGAIVVKRRRGMQVFWWTNVTGKQDDIVIGDTRPYPLSATVTPPAPFSGSAEYKRTPDGERTWTGSLAVTLPGLGLVPLTGPDFDPRLCQLSGCSGNSIDGHALPLVAPAHDWRQAR